MIYLSKEAKQHDQHKYASKSQTTVGGKDELDLNRLRVSHAFPTASASDLQELYILYS